MSKTTFNNGPLANVDLETKALADGGLAQIVAEQYEPGEPGFGGGSHSDDHGDGGGDHEPTGDSGERPDQLRGWPGAVAGQQPVPDDDGRASDGAPVGDSIFLMVNGRTRLTNFKMILTTATTATARYTFYL